MAQAFFSCHHCSPVSLTFESNVPWILITLHAGVLATDDLLNSISIGSSAWTLHCSTVSIPDGGVLPTPDRSAVALRLASRRGSRLKQGTTPLWVSNLAFPPDVPTHFRWSWLSQNRQYRWGRTWLSPQ